jgi:putative RecB family exonuclease
MTETATVPTLSSDVDIIGSLSPSRASDFKTCPLLYRFRSIDRLPETPTRAATRGTVVHSVLERLFDLPAAERTLLAAQDQVEPVWTQMLTEHPELEALFDEQSPAVELASDGLATDVLPTGERPADELEQWLDSARDLVANYFLLEDPSRLEPAAREERVEVVLDGLRLRGFVDRLDISPAGDIRVVDYKTGSIPREAFEAKALFQMKFYALVLWQTRGVVPRQLRLIYLADVDTLSYQPDPEELTRFLGTLRAIWTAIEAASRTGDFRPSPSRLCDWCSYQPLCPAKGGTLPPYPGDPYAAVPSAAALLDEPALAGEL